MNAQRLGYGKPRPVRTDYVSCSRDNINTETREVCTIRVDGHTIRETVVMCYYKKIGLKNAGRSRRTAKSYILYFIVRFIPDT